MLLPLNNMVSVIIPCFNQGAYLQETVDSVYAQTYTNIEIIVVDDGSDDTETIAVLEKIQQQGVSVVHTKNSGVSAARNTGIAAAKGTYILPLDGDDKIAPEYIAEAVKIMTVKTEVKLVYSDCEYFGAVTGLSTLPSFSMQGMLSENLIFNAALMRKHDIEAIGGYDPSFLTGWEDWEFWLRFIKTEKEVYKLPAVYFFYRRKEISRNESLTGERRALCERQLFKKHADLFLTEYKNPIGIIKDLEFYKKEYSKIETYRRELLNSSSYKLGHSLLSPLKWLKKKFSK